MTGSTPHGQGSELCAKCGAPVYRDPAMPQARLCPRHLREAIAVTPPRVDGSRVTPGTEGCKCDGPCWACNGRGCEACDDGQRICEMPCWQRLGLTGQPCCPDCAPLEERDPEPVADVVPIRGQR